MKTIALSVLLLGGCSAAVAAEVPYPSRPIRLIEAFPPGGGSDYLDCTLRLCGAWQHGAELVAVDDLPFGAFLTQPARDHLHPQPDPKLVKVHIG